MERNPTSHFVASNELYEASLKQKHSFIRRALLALWTVLGLGGLIWFAWAEPFSGRLLSSLIADGAPAWAINWLALPLVMMLRAVLLVESAGYAYHRFMQHVGWFTRRAQAIRKNQRFHWIHHMVIYPIGRFYKRTAKYIPSEKGLSLSWFLPALLITGLFLLTHGFNIGTLAFIAGFALFAKYVVDEAHSRFHEAKHSWVGKRYFTWLEEIHLLHHWDQRFNFTIVHPAMDWLFGTYLAPRKYRKELAESVKESAVTVSDMINWRYLLIEATPVEYAAFISAARRNPRALRKIGLLISILSDRSATHPEDAQARDLHQKAQDLLKALGDTPTTK